LARNHAPKGALANKRKSRKNAALTFVCLKIKQAKKYNQPNAKKYKKGKKGIEIQC
jgi:hypothetical protein